MLLLCLLFAGRLVAQPWHQLTMNDFQGMPPGANPAYVAYTNCQIHYSYDTRLRNGVYYLTFDVGMAMDHAKSWMNKVHVMEAGMLNEVLQHEQGHYNMAYLEQQELIQAFNQQHYGPDFRSQVSAIFTAIDRKYRSLNESYEQDSMHMLNREKQAEWNAWFRQQVDNYRNYAYENPTQTSPRGRAYR